MIIFPNIRKGELSLRLTRTASLTRQAAPARIWQNGDRKKWRATGLALPAGRGRFPVDGVHQILAPIP
ncbi:hypothetical protein LH19_03265 [Sphingopyxis macrogoltabida]|nr:hypothetical protein LH19_03265 [Sphingopyxis macrogoltabida]